VLIMLIPFAEGLMESCSGVCRPECRASRAFPGVLVGIAGAGIA
jgi:hypothetical protein